MNPSVTVRFGQFLSALGTETFNAALFDSIVASNAVIVEEKKEITGLGWKAKLEWMHNNGYTCEGFNSKSEGEESFTYRCNFVQKEQGKKFGQSKFAFVRNGKILAIRRSEDAVKYVSAHPYLPTAQTASNVLREGTFGFLVVVKEAVLRMSAKDGKPLPKNAPTLRPIPTPICVIYYEPGPVVVFDKKDKYHMEQLQKGWRLGTLLATRAATTCNPQWNEEGLIIVSKPAPFNADVINIEIYDQTDTGVVFIGSCHIPVNRTCFPIQEDWNTFENVPLWFGDRPIDSTVSFSVKIQNGKFPEDPINVQDIQLRAATSAELRSREVPKLKPKFKKTTLEKNIITSERIEVATEVLMAVGEVALAVTEFALHVAAH